MVNHNYENKIIPKKYQYLVDALDRGRTIQFLKTRIGNFEIEKKWFDWNAYGLCFDEDIKYQIKPDLEKDLQEKRLKNISDSYISSDITEFDLI